jgi:hypothetical protein
MQDVVALIFLTLPGTLTTIPMATASDTGLGAPMHLIAPIPMPTSLVPSAVRLGEDLRVLQDTTKRKRAVAVEYSDAYYTRLKIHQVLSWTMLPLFALQYASGNQILQYGSAAPSWATSLHGPTATAIAGVFVVNTITGAWNLWEGRKNPSGRARRYIHSALMFIADAGFVYTGTLADPAETSYETRQQHKNAAMFSMGVATASWLMMLLWKD